jgi:hypothetical protein
LESLFIYLCEIKNKEMQIEANCIQERVVMYVSTSEDIPLGVV